MNLYKGAVIFFTSRAVLASHWRVTSAVAVSDTDTWPTDEYSPRQVLCPHTTFSLISSCVGVPTAPGYSFSTSRGT